MPQDAIKVYYQALDLDPDAVCVADMKWPDDDKRGHHNGPTAQ
jgi:hypothetical protein